MVDVVNGIRLTPAANAGVRPSGAFSGTGAANGWQSAAITSSILQPTNTVTMLWRGQRLGNFIAGGFGYFIGLSSSGSFTTPFNAYCMDDGAVNNGVRLAWNNAGSAASSASFTTTQVGGIHQYLGTIIPGRQYAFQRTGSPPIQMSATSITSITYSSGLIGIGAHPTSTGAATNTVTELACIWNRPLSYAESAWLYDEPYAMFKTPGA